MNNIQHNPRDMDVVYLGGRLDSDTAPDLEKALDELIDTSHTRLIINCKNLEYISSAGLGILLSASKKVRNIDGDIRITGLKVEIKEVFEISGLTQFFTFFDTEDAAIRSYL